MQKFISSKAVFIYKQREFWLLATNGGFYGRANKCKGERFGKPKGKTTKYVYIKSTTVYAPSSELGLSQPLPTSVPLSPEPGGWGGGGALACGMRGWRSPNSDDWRKSLALCLLCGKNNKTVNLLRVVLLFILWSFRSWEIRCNCKISDDALPIGRF